MSSTDRAAFRPGTGWATGVGSLPHTDPGEASAVVAGELPDLPHLPELPARGPGADMVGRAAALLVDLHVDVQPSGWRLVDRPGLDERRARGYLSHDLDELEKACQGASGPVKLQVAGPWTTAAALRLPRGEPVLADPGATRDVVASLTEGLAGHVADLRRRLPAAAPLLQLDEPSLPAVLAGGISSTSGARRFEPVAPATAEAVLRSVVAALDVPVLAHCCAARPPVSLLAAAGVAGVSLDLTTLSTELDDEIGAALDEGLALLAGLVPALPAHGGGLSSATGTVEPVRRLWHRLGLPSEGLRQVVVTPTCGMAGATPAHAVAALRLATAAARQLADDPEG
ncbi:MAG: methionine synthase [Actinomycetes bacterium]